MWQSFDDHEAGENIRLNLSSCNVSVKCELAYPGKVTSTTTNGNIATSQTPVALTTPNLTSA
jgi:hypothetical protein